MQKCRRSLEKTHMHIIHINHMWIHAFCKEHIKKLLYGELLKHTWWHIQLGTVGLLFESKHNKNIPKNKLTLLKLIKIKYLYIAKPMYLEPLFFRAHNAHNEHN